MGSKEATSDPLLEASSGSSVSPSPFQYSDTPGSESVLLNKSRDVNGDNDDNSGNGIVKGSVAEDENYVSGEEEFEMALDKPVLVGEGIEDEEFGASVEAGRVSGGVEGEKPGSDFDAADVKDVEVGSFGGKGEFLDSLERLSVGSDEKEVERDGRNADGDGGSGQDEKVELGGDKFEVAKGGMRLSSEPRKKGVSDVAAEEFEKFGEEESGLLDTGNGSSEPQEKVVSEVVAEKVEKRGEGSWEEGEGLLGERDVLSEPQEEVISEMVAEEVDECGEDGQKNGEGGLLSIRDDLNEPQEKVVSEVVAANAEKEGEGGLLSIRDELGEPQEKVVSEVVVVNPAESEGDANYLPTGDSVVDSIQVDVVHPGVVVVREMEENGYAVNEPEKDVPEGDVTKPVAVPLGNADTAEGEVDIRTVGEYNERGDANVLPTGDSVVGAIQVDVVHPGVAVIRETEENGYVVNGPEKDVPEVNVTKPVAIPLESGDTAEGEVDIRTVGVYNDSSEPADQNAGDAVESKALQPELSTAGVEKDEKSDAAAAVDLSNGVHTSVMGNDSVSRDGIFNVEDNGITAIVNANGEVRIFTEVTEQAGSDGNVHQLHITNAENMQTNGDNTSDNAENHELADGVSEEPKQSFSAEPRAKWDEIKVEDETDEVHLEDSVSDGDSDVIFGGSEDAKKFIEELERASGVDSHARGDRLLEQSQMVDSQIVTDSEGEDETYDAGDGKELFDSASLAALLKAATGADSSDSSITITSQDGSRLFTVERPAGLGSSLQSLRPAPRPNRANIFSSLTPDGGGGESEDNLSEEEKKKLEKLQHIRIKFLRLVHKLGLSPEESVAAQVLYRLSLLGGRPGTQTFSLDAAKRTALQLEEEEKDGLDFSVNILVIGKSGVGKSATINSIFGEEKALVDAFETGTSSAKEISGLIDGVKVKVVDTPGLKPSVVEQDFNRGVLSSVKKFTKKKPFDVVLYVDRLDAQSRDLNDLPLLKTVTNALGSSIWRNAIVTLTHAASAPPDGPSGTSLSYEVYVSQRSHVVQQSIGHAMGDIRMMSPSLMNPVSLVENHPNCRKNRDNQKILPNGQSWKPQLLLLCYAMKILSEAGSVSKQQDVFDHRKLFGYRARSPPLPYMLSSMLQSRPHPKLPSDQGGDNADSDIDLDDLSDLDQDEEDEYDQLPPFKPLKKAQIAKLTREQRRAYYEEYDYRVKLLQKKQWKEELRRMREIKKNGKNTATDYGVEEEGADAEAAAPVAVPLPDMALPPSFDGDNPAYRYRFLEPVSRFLARPVLDTHGWDHDCGYDGVNLEHTLAITEHFPAVYTIQITKDKKDFSISLDSSISAKHGDKISSMAGFDIQAVGKQLAYTLRAETKFNNLKKNKAAGGVSFTFLGDNVVPGVKVEDQITLGKQYSLVGSAGAVRSQHDTAYGANLELQRRELDYPIGQVQSTLSMSIIKWRGDLALGFNGLAQFSAGRNSKVAVRAGINNKLSGQVTVRTSSSEHLSLALAAVIPTALSIYRKLYPGSVNDKYSIY